MDISPDAAWPDSARFAIYAAPAPNSALDQFGRAWLGNPADDAGSSVAPSIAGLSEDRWRRLTKAPRHYGFHGTLKAPFQLLAGMNFADLHAALARFAVMREIVEVQRLRIAQIAGFLALIPATDSKALHGLADACVETFDRFRRPETAEEIARRKTGLNARQTALLDRWGYPYVFEEFRFHMTLTEPVSADESVDLQDALKSLGGGAFDEPFTLDAICLFAQLDRALPFRLVSRFPLARR